MKQGVRKTMLYLLKSLWGFDRKTFFAVLLHILAGVLTPFLGVFIPSIVMNLLLQRAELTTFIITMTIVLGCYGILLGTFDFFKEYNALSFVELRGVLFERVVYLHRSHLDYAYLEDEKTKQLLEDAILGCDGNAKGVEGMYHDFIEFAIAMLGLVLYALTSSNLSLFLTIGLLLLVIVQYACFIIARNYEDAHRQELNGYLVRCKYLNNLAYDPSAGKDIRLYQLQGWLNEKFQALNQLIAHIKAKDYGAYMIVDSITVILDCMRDILCYGYLIYLLMDGMSIDVFVFYLGIVSGFSLWFKKVGEAYTRLSSNHVMVNHMFEALKLRNHMHHGTGEKLASDKITITFDHVSFHYPNQERFILDDISFTIAQGEKLALVGINGAGKSTIVKLILGFYEPTSGAVLINGMDTRALDLDDLYLHITGIFQDSALMSYTIAENVGMCDLSDCDLPRVRQCLQKAGIWDMIQELPEKELTYLYKDIQAHGIQLSGGQVQKLLMARMLYHEGGCLLLDEPSAALDALAESELYETYEQLTKGKTSLFISHRLNSTKFCDQILVLDQGHIIEQGSHEGLLSQAGAYARMFEVQSKYYREEETDESI